MNSFTIVSFPSLQEHTITPPDLFSPESKQNDATPELTPFSDYNTRYQRILDFIRDSFLSGEINTPEWEPAIQDLIVLEEEFRYYVETYARLIVTELHLPIEKKSLKPLSVSDTTHNEMYYLNNIIFKVARNHGVEYSDYIAAKLAGHTLKGIEAYSTCFFLKLRLPLTAIVDYFGYRVICVATLDPKSIFHLDSTTKQLMKEANLKLNLTPFTDEILQLFDFSQALPPTAPRSVFSQEHFYQRFRKEAVQAYGKPLCSTAFSNPIETDPERIQNNQDIQDATTWLLEKLIPESICHVALDITTKLLHDRFDQINLSYLLHREGINMRYLGVLFSHLVDHSTLAPGIILIEIYARTIKNELRRFLRESVSTHGLINDQVGRIITIQYLNAIFTNTTSRYYDTQQDCWEVLTDLAADRFFLKQEDLTKFFRFSLSSLSHGVGLLDYSFRTVTGRCYLFRRVVDLMKLNLHETVYQRLERFKSPSSVSPFSITDFFGSFNTQSIKIHSLLSIAKPLFTFYHSQQWIVSKKTTLQFPRSIITALKTITARSPSHPILISYLAFAMSFHLSFNKISWKDPEYQETDELFTRLINQWGIKHPKTLALCYRKYGQFQRRCGGFGRADLYFLKALKLNPGCSENYEMYSEFLKKYYPDRVEQIRKCKRQAKALKQCIPIIPTYQSSICLMTNFDHSFPGMQIH